jgi:copper chaperone CopZ
MKTSTFKIEDMHCDGCAETIKALVEQEPGVRMADVSFKNGEARVLYDSQAVTEGRIVAAIERPGFRVVSRR